VHCDRGCAQPFGEIQVAAEVLPLKPCTEITVIVSRKEGLRCPPKRPRASTPQAVTAIPRARQVSKSSPSSCFFGLVESGAHVFIELRVAKMYVIASASRAHASSSMWVLNSAPPRPTKLFSMS